MNLYDRYVYWRLGPAARLVYLALENHDAWDCDDGYTLKHKPSSTLFWVANDWQNFRVYKPKELNCFTKFERKALWAKYEQWKTIYLFTRMAGMG